MKLHRDKFSFLNIIGLIHGVTGIREDILEKDYYVTLLLKELSERQETLPEYISLPRTSRKELEDDRKGSITAVYDYTPAVKKRFDNHGQAKNQQDRTCHISYNLALDFIGKLRADEGEEGGGNNAWENSFFISSSSVCYGTTHTERTTPFPQIHTEYF